MEVIKNERDGKKYLEIYLNFSYKIEGRSFVIILWSIILENDFKIVDCIIFNIVWVYGNYFKELCNIEFFYI